MAATDPATTIEALIRSFRLSLLAENKSARTIAGYLDTLRVFTRFLAEHDLPLDVAAIERRHVEAFMADQLARLRPSTAATRYKGLRVFFGWCVADEELAASPMERIKPPIVPEEPPPVLEEGQIGRLLKVVAGRDFESRRDRAVITLLLDTGIRRQECAGLTLDDIDLEQRVAVVLGKGRRPRVVPFGVVTARSVDRYLRLRDGHRLAYSKALWLGSRGRTFTAEGIRQMLERRGVEAGIPGLHAHLFRHSFAHEHLAAGGKEGDLMMLTGWKSRQMLHRYAASTAAKRARDAYVSPVDRMENR